MNQPPKVNLNTDNAIVRKLLSGSAPVNLRMMAARGALPIGVNELMHVLFLLALDTDQNVQKAARETAWHLDEAMITPVLSNTGTDPQVLDAFARISTEKESAQQAIVQNSATLVKTHVFLATKAKAPVLEIMVTNQVRLINHPEIMDAMLTNPNLLPDHRRRIHEIREEFFVKAKLEKERLGREAEEAVRKQKEFDEADARALIEKAKQEALREVERESDQGKGSEPMHAGANVPLTQQKLMELSVPEKIERAIKGSKGDRQILVRDGSKVVREAVIESPKLSESEIEAFASMRNLPEEILRLIGTSREWTKKYSVVLNLVRNPKFPVTLSMKFISRLHFRDLKILSTDKNIPDVVRKAAKASVDRKAAGAGKKK